ncbi:MAG: hypothetical protein JEZ06_01895 [Anaerolineaceae bacterium]|nr:hypothetical protein [Anaerolineaceae bacterium]
MSLQHLESNINYQAILSRRSTRRYEPDPLTDMEKAQVLKILSQTTALSNNNHFEVKMFDALEKDDLIEKLGGYGRILSPPHYLLPSINGTDNPLVDLGNQVEQIAVRLNAIGIATCFVGAVGRETKVRELFHLPESTRIGAFLIFGKEDKNLAGKTINTVIRSAAGAGKKHPIEKIFFLNDFDHPEKPPAHLFPVIEAARKSPSAVNAQPWRLLWHQETLWVFVTRNNARYGSETSKPIYALYDGGISIGNMILAMQALKIEGQWELINDEGENCPQCPDDLQPIAKLNFFQP